MRERLTYGRQDACSRCGQDIEWQGRARGWRDRGNGQECLPYTAAGAIQHPKGKHTRRANRPRR